MNPSYNIQDFFDACRKHVETPGGQYVFITERALVTAMKYSGFQTHAKIFSFFASRPILKYQNSNRQKNNENETQGLDIDSYTFMFRGLSQYVSVLYSPKHELWKIKSLKPNNKQITPRL